MENANLVLRTVDASFTNNDYTLYTWKNINLRNLLGPMYDKYELFNLCLRSITTGLSSSTLGQDVEELTAVVNITGLAFINQTYNPKTGNNETEAKITTFDFKRSLCTTTYFNDNVCFTFGKSQDISTITISLENIYGDLLISSVAYPDCVYMFTIVGVPSEKTDNLPTRMDNNTGRLK